LEFLSEASRFVAKLLIVLKCVLRAFTAHAVGHVLGGRQPFKQPIVLEQRRHLRNDVRRDIEFVLLVYFICDLLRIENLSVEFAEVGPEKWHECAADIRMTVAQSRLQKRRAAILRLQPCRQGNFC